MSDDLTGRVNGWRCDTCGKITYAVHVDHGVTPMFLACRADTSAKRGCRGMGVSLMYPPAEPPPHVVEAVAWEWFRPSPRRVRRMERAMRDHVEKGGLELRRITDAGRRALGLA